MTFKRKVYLRKKDNFYTFETKIKGKTVHLINLPNDYEKFLKEMCRFIEDCYKNNQKVPKSSFFQRDKWLGISQKLVSADYSIKEEQKPSSKVPTINIVRNPKKDDSYLNVDALIEGAR